MAATEIALAPGPNPLLQAAMPILIVLGRIRTRMLAADSVERLLAEMAAAIGVFERSATAGDVASTRVRTAKYILCATVDDVMQNIPVDDPRIWVGKGMLITFFDSRDGGVRFFDELARARADPAGNRHLLQLFHACLAVGFLGRCRKEGGAPAAAVVQREVYDTLQRLNPARYEDLSPRWKGADVPLRQGRVRIPYWAAASCAALFLVTLYLMALGMLTARTGDAQAAMAAAVPVAAIDLRHLPVPGATAASTKAAAAERLPVDMQVERTTQLERIRAGLAEQIGARQVTVDASP
ncbi:type IVB secretion system protein IcmH/DotU, partial [Zavarzinia sp.]|uniref:type IVB secretion system protein IcmH/DotU n=1 Tax=Zavarzinia sp. TaxID=2027920 RepID=UPI00356238B2